MPRKKSGRLDFAYVRIDTLRPTEGNPGIHSDRQLEQIAKSIKQFGFLQPIVIDKKGRIIAGHGRVEAAGMAGLVEVPAVYAEHLTDQEKTAYLIADNKLYEVGEWNEDALRAAMESLGEFRLEVPGFTADQLAELMEPDRDVQEVEVPDAPAKPVSRVGDLWALGDHRVLCGDSTDPDCVARLMDGRKADMVFTDPPYGIGRDVGFHGARAFGGGIKKQGKKIARREFEGGWDGEIPPRECFELMLGLAPLSLIFGGNCFAHFLPQGKHWIVWDKKNSMPTFSDAELIWTNSKRESVKVIEFLWNGLVGKEKERFHPTQKPIGLLAKILDDYSKPGQLIADIFLGSGSTLIACEQTGRVCYGMELSPAYVDVIVKWWEDHTGRKAKRIK